MATADTPVCAMFDTNILTWVHQVKAAWKYPFCLWSRKNEAMRKKNAPNFSRNSMKYIFLVYIYFFVLLCARKKNDFTFWFDFYVDATVCLVINCCRMAILYPRFKGYSHLYRWILLSWKNIYGTFLLSGDDWMIFKQK